MLDYAVWYDDASNGATFTKFTDGVPNQAYTATGLTQGSTYQFKVTARNAYGYGDYSNIVTVLAAQIPARPLQPTT